MVQFFCSLFMQAAVYHKALVVPQKALVLSVLCPWVVQGVLFCS